MSARVDTPPRGRACIRRRTPGAARARPAGGCDGHARAASVRRTGRQRQDDYARCADRVAGGFGVAAAGVNVEVGIGRDVNDAEALLAPDQQLAVPQRRGEQLRVPSGVARLIEIPTSDPPRVARQGPKPVVRVLLEVQVLVTFAEPEEPAQALRGIADEQVGLADVGGAGGETQEKMSPRRIHASLPHGTAGGGKSFLGDVQLRPHQLPVHDQVRAQRPDGDRARPQLGQSGTRRLERKESSQEK